MPRGKSSKPRSLPDNCLNRRHAACYRVVGVLFALALAAVLGKAFFLQIVEHDDWTARAEAQRQTSLKVHAYRGTIRDREGKPLAISIPQYSLCADGSKIGVPGVAAERLHGILDEPKGELKRKLSTDRRFVWVKRHLGDRQVAAVRKLGLPGLYLLPEYKRYYPYGHLAGQVLGFVGVDNQGLEGVERAYERVLQQDTRSVGLLRDGGRKRLWRGERLPPTPEEGSGLRITLDAYLQYLCERELAAAAKRWQVSSGQVVVLDARTSEILALANWPFFDPNRFRRNSPTRWRNRALTDAFEPGSVFKVFLASALLETGTARPATRVFCEEGKFRYGGHTIHDVHPRGWLTLVDAIRYSSNVGAVKMADKLGAERYFNYIRKFGFGSETGVKLPGEASGLLRDWKEWREIDLATVGFGQGIGVTALQLATATACIANDGILRRPHIVGEADGGSDSGKRVVSSETARQVRRMMRAVVEEGGTGTRAEPPGYEAAGKTGTAQVADPDTGAYASDRHTAVFTGFVPYENPRLVIAVVMHEPQGSEFGGVVAAPIFSNVAVEALPYLGVYPAGETARLAHNSATQP